MIMLVVVVIFIFFLSLFCMEFADYSCSLFFFVFIPWVTYLVTIIVHFSHKKKEKNHVYWFIFDF